MSGPPPEYAGFENPYGYVPSKAAAIAFIALFGLTTIAHLGQTLFSRQRVWWTLVFVAGGIMEVVGWVGRLQSSNDPNNGDAFVLQISTLIIAPAWISAGCYAITGAMILRVGKAGSPLGAKAYTIIFVICDIISIGLQAAGGASAGDESNSGGPPVRARILLLTGIVFQLFTMLVYITLSLRYFRIRWADFTPLRKRLIQATIFASLCIIARGILRTAELGEGLTGFIFTHESFTIFLDGLPILLSMIVFNAVHPGHTLDVDDPKLMANGDANGQITDSRREKERERVAA